MPGVIIHELSHHIFCIIFSAKVIDVCYYNFKDSSGYVLHEQPKHLYQNVLISTAPFLINSLIGGLIAYPTIINKLSTLGLLSLNWQDFFRMMISISIGMILINWAIRKGYIENLDDNEIVDIDYNHKNDEYNSEYNLAFHLCIIGIAILIGVILKEILSLISLFFSEEVAVLVKSFPVFPLCMIGGFVVQKISEKRNLSRRLKLWRIRRRSTKSINSALRASISIFRRRKRPNPLAMTWMSADLDLVNF